MISNGSHLQTLVIFWLLDHISEGFVTPQITPTYLCFTNLICIFPASMYPRKSSASPKMILFVYFKFVLFEDHGYFLFKHLTKSCQTLKLVLQAICMVWAYFRSTISSTLFLFAYLKYSQYPVASFQLKLVFLFCVKIWYLQFHF